MKIFIPIKENSQRVPHKNFRNFGGKPLYQHVLSKWIGIEDVEVWVDTDSREILDWIGNGQFENLYCYERRGYLRGDDVAVNDLIHNFLSLSNAQPDETIAQIHVTSPFLEPRTVVHAVKDLLRFESVSSCDVIQARLWTQDEANGEFIPINHNPLKLLPTQELQTVYKENSAFYMFRAGAFLKYGNRITGNHWFVTVDPIESMDIDTEEDFEKCLKLL